MFGGQVETSYLEEQGAMMIVTGEVELKADKIEEMIEHAQTMALATRKEEGCLAYRFSRSIESAATFYVYEEWESAEALQAHFDAPHTNTFNQHLDGALAESPDIKILRVKKR